MNEAAWFVYNLIRIESIKEYNVEVQIDMHNIMSTPKLYDDLLGILDRIDPEIFKNIEIICGTLPFTTIFSYKKNIPMITVRGESIEGICYRGDRVLLIEDVVSAKTKSTIDMLHESGLEVSKLLVLISKDDTVVSSLGIKDTYIVLRMNFIQYMLESSANNKLLMYHNTVANIMFNTMLRKKTNIILSCDVCSTNEIKKLISSLHTHIIGIKLHSEIIIDFDEEFISWLVSIKKAHNLVIIEDRKLSDKGSICRKQLTGTHSITKWADAVTSYDPCKNTFEALKECNMSIIPVTELPGDMIDLYRPHIAGLLTETGGLNRGYLTMASDISLDLDLHNSLLWIIGSEELYEHPENIKTYRETGMRHVAMWGL